MGRKKHERINTQAWTLRVFKYFIRLPNILVHERIIQYIPVKGDIFLITRGDMLGFGTLTLNIEKWYKLHLSYATLRERLLRARKPEEGTIHARIRLVTFERHSPKSYRWQISFRIFTLGCTLQNDESFCRYRVETVRAMTQFRQTLKGFSSATYLHA